jgi:Methyltransferase domain
MAMGSVWPAVVAVVVPSLQFLALKYHLMMLYQALYPLYRRTGFSRNAKVRRFERICAAVDLRPGQVVLEVGCAAGVDFMQFAEAFHRTGVDIADIPRVCDFEFHKMDARSLPWPDKHFDAVVSIGVLEHIQPMDVLCNVTRELSRVAKRFCVIVPANGTLIEPHTWSPFWQLRGQHSKPRCQFELNYFSDEAWLQFPGFENAKTSRYWHAPGVRNLMIHG